MAAITLHHRCVNDDRPSDIGWRLYSHCDGSPLPVLLGSDGVGRRRLDFSRLGTMGDCSAFDSEFPAWPHQCAHDGTISRSDDRRRNRVGSGRADSWSSAYPLRSCFSVSYGGPLNYILFLGFFRGFFFLGTKARLLTTWLLVFYLG